tara:strand:+ start:122 stop:499 length:378 start_codon:yes stop_codon:yes gene_type:complete
MKLHRITHYVNEQNWFAVALDFVIVVVGILIAFQITSWSDARGDTADARAALEQLEQDFEQILDRTDRSITADALYVSAAGRLNRGIRNGKFVEETLFADLGRRQVFPHRLACRPHLPKLYQPCA